MKKAKPISSNRIQIASREKRASGKSLNIIHNKKIAGINKDLLSKIDNILIEYQLNNDLIPTFNTKFVDPLNDTTNKKILNQPEEQKISKHRSPSAGQKNKPPLDFDPNMPNININIDKKKKLPQVRKKKVYKGKKDGFLTGVGLIKQKKDNSRTNKFLAENDEEIKKMLNNIDEIDDFIKDPKKDKNAYLFEGSPDYKNKMEKNRLDFEELIREIDGYKKEMKEEFDEIQYLIKFTNNTEKLINRHKNVINGIFKGAGLSKHIIKDEKSSNKEKSVKQKRNKSQTGTRIQGYLNIVKEVDDMYKQNDEEDYEDYDDEFLATSVSELNGVFYKLKKINQIKENLSNIQDDCLGYHEKLKDRLKRSSSAKLPKTDEKILENTV